MSPKPGQTMAQPRRMKWFRCWFPSPDTDFITNNKNFYITFTIRIVFFLSNLYLRYGFKRNKLLKKLDNSSCCPSPSSYLLPSNLWYFAKSWNHRNMGITMDIIRWLFSWSILISSQSIYYQRTEKITKHITVLHRAQTVVYLTKKVFSFDISPAIIKILHTGDT